MCPVLSSGIFAPNLLKVGSSGKKMTATCHPYPVCFRLSVVVPVGAPPLCHLPVFRELVFIPACAICIGDDMKHRD